MFESCGEKGGNNLIVKLQAYEYVLSLELGRRFNSVIGSLLMISGAFGAFWKKDVRALGEYDMDTITEDFDITLKVRKLGKRLVFADKAVSWTFAPENWRDWRRQRIRWCVDKPRLFGSTGTYSVGRGSISCTFLRSMTCCL